MFSRPRRLPADKLKAVKAESIQMLQLGIICPSSNPWASPLYMVPKRCGYWCPTGDYRRLNAITVPDRCPIPHIRLRFLCMIVRPLLVKAIPVNQIPVNQIPVHQIPVNPADKPKTAVTTPFGEFEFLTMLFGLRNATSNASWTK